MKTSSLLHTAILAASPSNSSRVSDALCRNSTARKLSSIISAGTPTRMAAPDVPPALTRTHLRRTLPGIVSHVLASARSYEPRRGTAAPFPTAASRRCDKPAVFEPGSRSRAVLRSVEGFSSQGPGDIRNGSAGRLEAEYTVSELCLNHTVAIVKGFGREGLLGYSA